MDEINVGAVVWLKSGGPAMTVEKKVENFVFCVWFGDEGIVAHRAEFNEETLELVPKERTTYTLK